VRGGREALLLYLSGHHILWFRWDWEWDWAYSYKRIDRMLGTGWKYPFCKAVYVIAIIGGRCIESCII